ncbi:dTDP-4-dehydrorhamnose 3,5-epimerase [Pseudomonas sp. SIMBA_077]
MKFSSTPISGLVIIEPKVFHDERGWFMESFNLQRFRNGLQSLSVVPPECFVQDNISSSKKGVLRGLHYQLKPFEQGKLVSVLQGAIFDVAVDLRTDSATYGKWFALELNDANKKMLWIPGGFAHGFLALKDDTRVSYKVTHYYDKGSERSVLWNDKSLNIKWPEMTNYFLSEKDRTASVLGKLPE